jgi:hypothetical protein
MTPAAMLELLKRERAHAERAGVALLFLVIAMALGLRARRVVEPANRELAILHGALERFSVFRTTYQAPSDAELKRWSAAADSNDIVAPKGSRLALAQRVARTAEQVGLHDVRVRFSTRDSLVVTPRPKLIGRDEAPANYTIVMECRGSFAAVLALIKQLPLAVSVIRVSAANEKSVIVYRLTLDAYETTAEAREVVAGLVGSVDRTGDSHARG